MTLMTLLAHSAGSLCKSARPPSRRRRAAATAPPHTQRVFFPRFAAAHVVYNDNALGCFRCRCCCSKGLGCCTHAC
jgi:hypothetical protein